MFHGHSDYFQKPSPGCRPNTKLGDHATPNTHNHWFTLFYHVWRPTWIDIHWNSSWLRAQSHMISHYTWGSVTTLDDFGGVLGRALEHFLLGSHNFMVTALGSCVVPKVFERFPMYIPKNPKYFKEVIVEDVRLVANAWAGAGYFEFLLRPRATSHFRCHWKVGPRWVI